MEDPVEINRRIERLVKRVRWRDDYGELLFSGEVIRSRDVNGSLFGQLPPSIPTQHHGPAPCPVRMYQAVKATQALVTIRKAGDRLEGLSPGVEATAYRTVEEMLRSLNDATDVWVAVADEDRRLRIAIASSTDDRVSPEELTSARARLQILGGTLRISEPPHKAGLGIRLEAEIPLR